MSIAATICACDYAYDYEPPVMWPNAKNPILWDEEDAFFRMCHTFFIMHRLAKARILQALLDLNSNESIANQAFRWVFSDTSDFRAFCTDAGMSIEIVRHKAKDIIENGLKWRGEPGTHPRYEHRKGRRAA